MSNDLNPSGPDAADALEPDRGPGQRSKGWTKVGDDADRTGVRPDDPAGNAGPVPASGARDIGADELDPVTSGDGANLRGLHTNPDPRPRQPGGARLAGSVGDAGADAGDGSLDATDDTTVTGDPDVSPAARARGDDNVTYGGTANSGGGEGAGDPDTGYRQGGASGALGPEDLEEPGTGAVDPRGPDADAGPRGDPKQHGRDTGLGKAQMYPSGAGETNIQGEGERRESR
jgi:hypothetical protein